MPGTEDEHGSRRLCRHDGTAIVANEVLEVAADGTIPLAVVGRSVAVAEATLATAETQLAAAVAQLFQTPTRVRLAAQRATSRSPSLAVEHTGRASAAGNVCAP